jgi:hypothetical protein
MPNPPRLTGNQLLILDHAAQRPDSAVLPLPEELDLRGRARAVVLKSMLDRGLIERISAAATAPSGHLSGNFRITPAGRRALLAIKRE